MIKLSSGLVDEHKWCSRPALHCIAWQGNARWSIGVGRGFLIPLFLAPAKIFRSAGPASAALDHSKTALAVILAQNYLQKFSSLPPWYCVLMLNCESIRHLVSTGAPACDVHWCKSNWSSKSCNGVYGAGDAVVTVCACWKTLLL